MSNHKSIYRSSLNVFTKAKGLQVHREFLTSRNWRCEQWQARNESFQVNERKTFDGLALAVVEADGDPSEFRDSVDRQSDGTYKIWSKASSKALVNSSSTVDGYKIV